MFLFLLSERTLKLHKHKLIKSNICLPSIFIPSVFVLMKFQWSFTRVYQCNSIRCCEKTTKKRVAVWKRSWEETGREERERETCFGTAMLIEALVSLLINKEDKLSEHMQTKHTTTQKKNSVKRTGERKRKKFWGQRRRSLLQRRTSGSSEKALKISCVFSSFPSKFALWKILHIGFIVATCIILNSL